MASDTKAEDPGEIDRIMKEIEDLEKGMDAAPSASSEAESAAEESHAESNADDNVVPLRSKSSESLAETDAVPVSDDPLVKTESDASGGLALKVGGCNEISLEFSREGITVTLSCTESGLSITTDQGAEFRVPFNKRAA